MGKEEIKLTENSTVVFNFQKMCLLTHHQSDKNYSQLPGVGI